MLKSIELLCFGAAAMFAQSTLTWVPYSAKYTETTKDVNPLGRTISFHETVGEEIRTADGSLLTTVTIDGQRVTGRLWQACGQIIQLDYSRKQATMGQLWARKHPKLPPDTPQGKITAYGIELLAYPIHSDSGYGTIWINMDQDIPLKTEMHLTLPDGTHRDIVRSLNSLDLNPVENSSQMKLPSDFQVQQGRPAAGCSGK